MPVAAFVNSSHVFNTSSPAAFVATAGNLLVVGTRYNTGGASSVASVTDTAGNNYVTSGLRFSEAVNDFMEIWYAENCLGHATNVVTVNWAGGTPLFMAVGVGQYSGVNLSSAKDTTASGVNASPVVSGAFTTAQANELIVAFAQVAATGNTWSIPSGVLTTIRGQDASNVMCLVDAIVSSIQTGVTADMSTSNSNTKSIGVVTFKSGSALTTNQAFQSYFD